MEAVGPGPSPILRLEGSLVEVEFSDRPLPICQTGAPVQHGSSKAGSAYDENLIEQECGRLEVLQEFEQLPAERVEVVFSVLGFDRTIGKGTFYV